MDEDENIKNVMTPEAKAVAEWRAYHDAIIAEEIRREEKWDKLLSITCKIGKVVGTIIAIPLIMFVAAKSATQQPKQFPPFKPKIYRPTGGPRGYR